MDDIKQQVVDRLKGANNILVTVRNNPTLDLLSSCIGLALLLDKMDKHATAVFSGQVPSALEFLKPEETIEQTPDSLRDFIIALDKSKADKLRYKVEDKVVRIFITPYRTSITQDDLNFSQGDFNVDVVVALGAHEQAELDQAITSHGRILHDATVVSINNTPNGSLGSLNWQDTKASSVAEMIAQLVDGLGKDLLDEQISTALLTGIVAETERFSNDKTTPKTMSMAGSLMAAGANQQLVANKLQESGHLPANTSVAEAKPAEPAGGGDGALEVAHTDTALEQAAQPTPVPPAPEGSEAKPEEKPAEGREMLPMPEPGQLGGVAGTADDGDPFAKSFAADESASAGNAFLVDKPTTSPSPFDAPSDATTTALAHDHPPVIQPPKHDDAPPAQPFVPAPAADAPQLPAVQPIATEPPKADDDGQTLAEIEESVESPHAKHMQPIDVDAARSEVLRAIGAPPEKPEALGSNMLGPELHPRDDSTPAGPASPPNIEVDAEGNLKLHDTPPSQPAPAHGPREDAPQSGTQPLTMQLPSVMPAPSDMQPSVGPGIITPGSQVAAPPPVPPPLTPPGFMGG